MTMTEYQEAIRRLSPKYVVGIDEVGMGPLAGPVVVSGVLMSPETTISGLADSKQLSSSDRVRLREEIVKYDTYTYQFPAEAIDVLGILQCNHMAMQICVAGLTRLMPADAVLVVVDGNLLPSTGFLSVEGVLLQAIALTKADTYVPAVMAASIVAKVHRDSLMEQVDDPGYGFAEHKGYGTAKHKEALDRLGPSTLHRFSYKPVAASLRR